MSDALKRGVADATRNNFKEPYRDKYGMYGTEPIKEIEKDEVIETPAADESIDISEDFKTEVEVAEEE